MLFLLKYSPRRLKLEKIKPGFSSTTKNFSFFIKYTINNHPSSSDWWDNIEDARTFSENLRKHNFNDEKKAAKLIQKNKFQARN